MTLITDSPTPSGDALYDLTKDPAVLVAYESYRAALSDHNAARAALATDPAIAEAREALAAARRAEHAHQESHDTLDLYGPVDESGDLADALCRLRAGDPTDEPRRRVVEAYNALRREHIERTSRAQRALDDAVTAALAPSAAALREAADALSDLVDVTLARPETTIIDQIAEALEHLDLARAATLEMALEMALDRTDRARTTLAGDRAPRRYSNPLRALAEARERRASTAPQLDVATVTRVIQTVSGVVPGTLAVLRACYVTSSTRIVAHGIVEAMTRNERRRWEREGLMVDLEVFRCELDDAALA